MQTTGGTAVLSRGQWLKLVRVLGMLGSDHAGERAAAALAAHRLVRGWGTDWAALLAPRRMSEAERRRPRGPFHDAFHDPAAAAQSRLRQMAAEVARLEAEVKRLKRLLDARHQRG